MESIIEAQEISIFNGIASLNLRRSDLFEIYTLSFPCHITNPTRQTGNNKILLPFPTSVTLLPMLFWPGFNHENRFKVSTLDMYLFLQYFLHYFTYLVTIPTCALRTPPQWRWTPPPPWLRWDHFKTCPASQMMHFQSRPFPSMHWAAHSKIKMLMDYEGLSTRSLAGWLE